MSICTILFIRFLKARLDLRNTPKLVIEDQGAAHSVFEYPWNPEDWTFHS